MNRPYEFLETTKLLALKRQGFKCACCGEKICCLGQAGRKSHRFGEGAQAHHIRHIQQGGTNALSNCVIICESCHYCVHEGGNYRSRDIYATTADYRYFAAKNRP